MNSAEPDGLAWVIWGFIVVPLHSARTSLIPSWVVSEMPFFSQMGVVLPPR
jgi:hypothetical protein